MKNYKIDTCTRLINILIKQINEEREFITLITKNYGGLKNGTLRLRTLNKRFKFLMNYYVQQEVAMQSVK